MSDQLQATVQQSDEASLVRLAGILDEDNNLDALVAQVASGRAMIDLAGIERINSCGTRDWVDWITRLENKGIQPVFVACSSAIVAQLNLVRNFSGHGVVKSFYVPYHCPQCEEEKQLLVEVSEMGAAPYEPPVCRCDDCDGLMTFDDLPEAYFGFVAHAQKRLERSGTDSSPDLARGSTAKVKTRSRTRLSSSRIPMRRSSPSLSAFQTPENGHPSMPSLAGDRPSQRGLSNPVAPGSDRAFLFVIVALLVGAIGVLGFMLVR